MFLGHIRSLRNITTYVRQPGQEAEEHKVGPYVPAFLFFPPTFLFFPSLPTLLRPATSSPHTSHPGSPLPTRWPPLLCSGRARLVTPRPTPTQPRPAPQHASAAGPTCLSRALPDHAHRPHLTLPSSMRQSPGPACLGRAPPGRAHRPPSLAPPHQAGRADVPARPRVPSVGPTPPSTA
jgi:hypothetical protein